MYRTGSLFVLALFAAGMAAAAPLVQNGQFATDTSGWNVPPQSGWAFTNADGQGDNTCLCCQIKADQKTQPVTQTVTCSPHTHYVLMASLKASGKEQPAVRLVNAADGAELLRLRGSNVVNRWERVTARFDSGNASRITVQLWTAERQLQGGITPAGMVAFDDIQIVPEAEAASAEHATAASQIPWKNIARGRPYTLKPAPNYSYCTDPGDKVQLTDGQYTQGYFWTQKSTVGWTGAAPAEITIDLGSVQPIRGVSYSTAAGVAGVAWPSSITVLVSDDGKAYHNLGDLVTLSVAHGTPPETGYATYRFWTDQLKAHGRFMRLLVDAGGAYTFVDEIEVYRGEDAWTGISLPGAAITDTTRYFRQIQVDAAFKRRLTVDLSHARDAVRDGKVKSAVKAKLSAQLDKIQQGIRTMPPVNAAKVKAVFPINDLHARIFAVYGALAHAAGARPLAVWTANPWDFLTPTQQPPAGAATAVAVTAMTGETRAGVFNLTNDTDQPMTLRVRIEGLPGGTNPAYVEVDEVAWTDTREGTPVADALPPATRTTAGYRITVPAGMTRQVWLNITPTIAVKGTQQGMIRITGGPGGTRSIPLRLRVLNLQFPKQPALHVGGWDYTDVDTQYGVTPQNVKPLITHLRSWFVDSPWGTAACLPYGTYDAEGKSDSQRVRMLKQPDTAHFDTWITRWPGARQYCVFAAVNDSIAGIHTGTPAFDRAVGEWISFWVKHAATKGIKPEQVQILLVDEPHEHAQDDIIIAWAKAIKAAQPDVILFEDPTYQNPAEATPEMMESADILCPNRPMMLTQGDKFKQFYAQQHKAGRRLDFYSCSGPARLLDPYSYHRLQAWSCFEMGAESTFFWALGDTGDGDSWNEYGTHRTSYCPLFLGPDSVTDAKHMEAIRESVEDFQYLTMLRDRIAAVEKKNPQQTALSKARDLLATACTQVLDAKGADELSWTKDKDRSIADRVRIEIGDMLEKLAE